MTKYLSLVIAFTLIFELGSAYSQTPNNAQVSASTLTFIKLLKKSDAVLKYGKTKSDIEKLAAEIKQSSLPSDDKEDLEKSYNKAYDISNQLYDSIVNTIKTREGRSKIKTRDAQDIFFTYITGQLNVIAKEGQGFKDQYDAVLKNRGQAKSPGAIATIFVQILYPIAKEFFIEYVEPKAITKIANSELRDRIVIRSWSKAGVKASKKRKRR